MSHFLSIVSSFKDKAALVAALTKCAVPREAIAVSNNGPMAMTGYYGDQTTAEKAHVVCVSKGGQAHHKTNRIVEHLRADVGFLLGDESKVIVDKYQWPSQLCGCNEKPGFDNWIKRVRMEYDCEVSMARARSLGKPAHRVEHGGKVYAFLGA